MKKALLFLCMLLMLTGCTPQKQPVDTHPVNPTISQDQSIAATEENPVEVTFPETDAEMFTGRDTAYTYDETKAVIIELNGNTAKASSDSVQISGSTVTIKEEATYIISGSLADGMLLVDAPDTAKLQLVFGGVQITNRSSAALYILEADKVFITLAEGSVNTLANGGGFTPIDDNNIDAPLFSKQDLTINGTGSLTVTSPAGHGIVCKDDLVITGGNLDIQSASHGLDANDSVRIGTAVLNIDAGKDAIHCENTDDPQKGFFYLAGGTVKGEGEGDGIAASGYMHITDGTVDLLLGGGSENGTKESSDFFGGFMGGGPGGGKHGPFTPGSFQSTVAEEEGTSMKGLKAGGSMLLSGGSITLNCADDAIHSDASITVNGGTYTLSSGDDAIHAEDTLTVTAGKIDILESYEGLEALHIDVRGGQISLVASDDGLNAAGGTDQSGITGGRDGMFGGKAGGRPGGGFGGMSSNSGGSITISGGTLSIRSSGDGIDANGTLEISGGYTVVTGPTQGDTATLDYDLTATITGGTFIGTGAYGMAQTFSDSTQGVVAISVGNLSAGTQITLADTAGNVLLSHQPELTFAVVILSSPELRKGETYTVTLGTETGDVTAS